MSDENTKQENGNAQNPIDLSSLSNLEFKTAWTPASMPGERAPRPRDAFFNKRGDRGDANDRRPQNKPDFRPKGGGKPRSNFRAENGGEENFRGNSQRRNRDKNNSRGGKNFPAHRKHVPFSPTMEVLFYPDDAPFEKLSAIMKASKRTYQLFDIAQLILEKPERFVILAKNLPMPTGETKPLYCAQPFNLPFDEEQDAKRAAIEYFVGELFTRETIEAEAPKGNFQVVNKSSITGDLLGAPNWHKYGEYLREYHAEKCPDTPFEKFSSSVESVRDPEQIAAWIESMKTRTVYKLKNPAEGEDGIFDTREAASNYIAHKMAEQLVKTYEQVRFRGANLSLLPHGRIRRNIEEACRKQRRFPIVTANNLRGRLRRAGFSVYKRGSKGFAFVSVIKRKFLFEGETLADLPQKIFDFILANPAVPARDLPYKMLDLTPPQQQRKEKTLAEENRDGAMDSSTPPDASQDDGLDESQKARMAEIWSELTWLISEGYVVEYADGTLQANPFLPKPKEKVSDSKLPDGEHGDLGAADEPVISQPTQTEKGDESTAGAGEQASEVPPTEPEGESPGECGAENSVLSNVQSAGADGLPPSTQCTDADNSDALKSETSLCSAEKNSDSSPEESAAESEGESEAPQNS